MLDNVLWSLNGYDTRMRLNGHRVKYRLDNFLDHFFLPFFWTIVFGTIFIGPFYKGGSTPLVLREG